MEMKQTLVSVSYTSFGIERFRKSDVHEAKTKDTKEHDLLLFG